MQASLSALSMDGAPPPVVSDLSTAAKEGASMPKVKVIEKPQMSEINPGVWDGLTPDQAKKFYPEEWARFVKDPYAFRAPRAESYHDLSGMSPFQPSLRCVVTFFVPSASRTRARRVGARKGGSAHHWAFVSDPVLVGVPHRVACVRDPSNRDCEGGLARGGTHVVRRAQPSLSFLGRTRTVGRLARRRGLSASAQGRDQLL